jgi:hypothetical protein
MLSHSAIQLAKLGGYLFRKNDPPPGHIVMWRSLTRLTDIALGMQLAAATCGQKQGLLMAYGSVSTIPMHEASKSRIR